MIQPRYLSMFFAGLVLWLALHLAFVLIVDPYRVSPFQVSWKAGNLHKPKRIDIDRLIKPFEVWRNTPRTIFLGTSRIHQAIVPSHLNGTRYAPAYNASIPASTLQLSFSHLQKYIELDPDLKTIFIELFFSHFLDYHYPVAMPEAGPVPLVDVLRDASVLFVSGDAFLASVQTLYYNSEFAPPCPEIHPEGYITYPYARNRSAKGNFDGFNAPFGIWKTHGSAIHAGNQFKLQESAFTAVEEMVKLCKARGVDLMFVLTPTHAYHDYYFDSFGGTKLVAEWLKRVSAVAEVYTIPLPSEVVYEPVQAAGMRYWSDPIHFTIETGWMIENALSGINSGRTSDKFAVRMRPDLVDGYLQDCEKSLMLWVSKNPDFVAAFQYGRQTWEAANPP